MSRILTTFLAMGLSLPAIAGLHTAPALAQAAGERVVIADDDPDWGLPAPYLQGRGGMGYILTSWVFDNLVGQDAKGKPAPELAREWKRSPDGLSFDLTLDEAARWHDGEDVTSADVAFTFDYMRTNPHVFVSLANVAGTEILDEDRIRITLSEPDAGFEAGVLMGLPILPQHIYEGRENPRRFTDDAALTGTGPFRLVSHDRAQGRYVLAAVEDYYRGAPRFGELLVVKMSSEAAIEAIRAGEVDVMTSVPFRLIDRARKAGLSIIESAAGHPAKLRFEHEGVFADVRLRQGLAHAIDRAALAKIAYRGGAVPANLGYLQDGSRWFNPEGVATYPPDTERAAALFSQAGWARGDDGRWMRDGAPVTLRIITQGREERLAVVLVDQLEAFGIGAELRVLESGAYREAVDARDYDLALAIGSTMGDPSTVRERVFGMKRNNERFTGDGRLRALADAQARALDPTERAELLHQFQEAYAEELPTIMLVNTVWAAAHGPRVTPFFFPDGVAVGIPMAIHKYTFLK